MNLRRRLASLLLGATLVALLTAGAASAAGSSLVLGRSMAGVRLGDSLARLHRVLGEPKAVRHVRNEIAGTDSGIGVGTRKRRLEREFPSMTCHGRTCAIVAGGGLQTIGKRVTDFRMHNGRVKIVSIGRVID